MKLSGCAGYGAGARAAEERLLRPGTEVAPRKMWPTGMSELGIDLSGRIPPAVQAQPGRVVARLTDLGWGARLRAVLAPSDPDGPVPADLVDAVVKVLAAWDWAERPAAVVALPSRSRPELVASLASQIAAIGRLPHVGTLDYAAERPAGEPRPRDGVQHNSAQRLRAVWQELILPEPVAKAAAAAGGPVLLVDDRIESGWTMTVAAKLLRDAGVPAVLPLALASSG